MTKFFLKQVKKGESYFNTKIFDNLKNLGKTKGKLSGLFFSVKDSICINGVEVSAGSKILKGYIPVFDSFVVKKLKKEGGVVIGTTSMDEFGFGSFSKNVGVGFNIPKNPHDNNRVTGGSSGGGAALTSVLSDEHFSLGESTGGSVVNPASLCGVIGFCPSYGVISRHGLISYADSLDKIGIFSKKVSVAKKVFDISQGFDSNDLTTVKKDLMKVVKKPRLGVLKNFLKKCDEEVRTAFEEYLKKLKTKGFEIIEIELPLVEEYSIPCYYILAFSEASTNLARFNGLRYGFQKQVEGFYFENYFTNLRSENFGVEAKRRILLGTFVRMSGLRDQYYSKAAKVRRLILEEYNKIFTKIDLLVCPTTPTTAPTLKQVANMSPAQEYSYDVIVVGPNLAGLPHASIPMKKTGLPAGFMIVGGRLNDLSVFEFMAVVSKL